MCFISGDYQYCKLSLKILRTSCVFMAAQAAKKTLVLSKIQKNKNLFEKWQTLLASKYKRTKRFFQNCWNFSLGSKYKKTKMKYTWKKSFIEFFMHWNQHCHKKWLCIVFNFCSVNMAAQAAKDYFYTLKYFYGILFSTNWTT